jgi:hypothetical protein
MLGHALRPWPIMILAKAAINKPSLNSCALHSVSKLSSGDQINTTDHYQFDRTLLYYLSLAQIFNKQRNKFYLVWAESGKLARRR